MDSAIGGIEIDKISAIDQNVNGKKDIETGTDNE
jgi:hypothetical protein